MSIHKDGRLGWFLPQEDKCYWVDPTEGSFDHHIGDPAHDVLDHSDEQSETNNTPAPGHQAGTFTFPFFANFFFSGADLLVIFLGRAAINC